MQSFGYAAQQGSAPLTPFQFQRRDPSPDDVVIAIQYCGVCHSDLHQVRNEWGESIYPMVPGHEIVGTVTAVGSSVTRFKIGDPVGVGVIVDSCRVCENCKRGLQQYCQVGTVPTYNGTDRTGAPTYGGYSNNIVAAEGYVYNISPKLDAASVAPLLCAGITTYSPLRHWGVTKGKKVGVVGLGGLGHMALKFAHAFGAHVVQFTTSLRKTEDARRLGADEVVLSKDAAAMKAHANSFDFILDTVSGAHDLNSYLELLRLDGTMTLVGLPEQPPTINVANLITNRRSLAGSGIGGIPETQEMLDFCAAHNITADVEVIPVQEIDQAYERMLRNDVKYRFVIDAASLPKQP